MVLTSECNKKLLYFEDLRTKNGTEEYYYYGLRKKFLNWYLHANPQHAQKAKYLQYSNLFDDPFLF